ncbi:MAG: sugar ABC transporter permease [Phycisphaerales bacterium]
MRTATGANRAAYLFLSPFLLVFLVFTVYPLVLSAVLAMQQTHGPGFARFVGLDNFVSLAGDPLFHKAVLNTVIYTLGSLFIQLPLALGLAMLLNQPGLKGRGFYRLIFFSPQLMGLVFVAMLSALIFEKRSGLLNQALHGALGAWLPPDHAFGWMNALKDVTWLDFPWLQTFVMPMLILISLWMFVGYNMTYFLAALQNIDRSLVEAKCRRRRRAGPSVLARDDPVDPPGGVVRGAAEPDRVAAALRTAVHPARLHGRPAEPRADHRDVPLPERVRDGRHRGTPAPSGGCWP